MLSVAETSAWSEMCIPDDLALDMTSEPFIFLKLLAGFDKHML